MISSDRIHPDLTEFSHRDDFLPGPQQHPEKKNRKPTPRFPVPSEVFSVKLLFYVFHKGRLDDKVIHMAGRITGRQRKQLRSAAPVDFLVL